MKSFLIEDKDIFILHVQYQICWCLGYTRSQVISNYGINLVLPEYYSFSSKSIMSDSVFLTVD